MPRKQKKYHFIYKTVNQVNGKYYIGMHSTDVLDDGYLGSGQRLWHSIRKYGKENFKRETLEFLPDRSSLKLREKEIVNEKLLQDPMCMNLKEGGEGGFVNNQHKENLRKSVVNSQKKRWKEDDETYRNFREKALFNIRVLRFSKENIEAWKETMMEKTGSCNGWKGRLHSEETKKRIGESNSKSQCGEKNSQFGMKWIHNFELKQNKRIKKDQEIPDGWSLGRKMKFKE